MNDKDSQNHILRETMWDDIVDNKRADEGDRAKLSQATNAKID